VLPKQIKTENKDSSRCTEQRTRYDKKKKQPQAEAEKEQMLVAF
jgi:hypothetical protein